MAGWARHGIGKFLGRLQRRQPRVCKLSRSVLGLEMLWPENSTCVFLGKNEGTLDWPRRAGRPAGASSYGHMGCVAVYTPCCIWRADGLGRNRRVMGRATEATADCLWFVAECFVAPIALAGKHDLRISRGKRGVTRIAAVSTSAGRWSMGAIAGLLWRSIPRAVSDW